MLWDEKMHYILLKIFTNDYYAPQHYMIHISSNIFQPMKC